MMDEGRPWPELALAAEMLRILGRNVLDRDGELLEPAAAAELLRRSADHFSCCYALQPD
jgi:hypothetical protein